jgi:tetratricopeptide (TPR) repeat protein
VYFNGKEAMKAGLFKVETRLEEDYTKTLPVFKESKAGAENLIASDMARAIEKGEKLIKLHSMTKPPKPKNSQSNKKRKPIKGEYNMFVDDAYIMIGKASLYKKDFIRASSTFTQIIRNYKNEPAKYEAYLWLIRTYSESERYTEAQQLVEALEGDNLFPKELEGELAINAADLHLKQQHLDEAIQYLNIGIKKIKGNKRKTRYTYILAQLYQETGKSDQALEAYRQVIRRRPDYTMLFNAQISSASVYSGKGNVAELRKQLNKMSKKVRNAEYLDQIYYALGNLSHNEGKTDEAIRYYKKSAAVSVKNTFQRILSCLTLGDIYLDQKKYIPSGNYYDSAMVIMDEFYPNYKAISEKNATLSKLVTNLQTVVTQDSLQALAKLSPTELNAKVDAWVLEATKKMQDPEGAGAKGEYGYASSMNYRTSLGSNSNTSWYFYNPSTVSYGKKEFSRLWGTRKNEDNWRRSNKSISSGDEPSDLVDGVLADDMKTVEKERADDPTKKEFYLQDIPNNDSLMAVSHEKIKEALFEAANILKSDFNDYENAVYYYKELNRRYPNNIYDLPANFGLWDAYTALGKPDSTLYFKNQVVNNYPESNYAKYLVNPNYFIEEEARKDSVNSLYAKAYDAYKRNDLEAAKRYTNMTLAMKPDSALIPQVEFIKTVADSKRLDKQQFAQSLNTYIETYPKAETAQLAQQLVNLIKEDKLTNSNYAELVNTGYLNEVIKNIEVTQAQPGVAVEAQAAKNKWETESELLHYFVIAIPGNDSVDINRLKYDIANYNIDNYTTLDFDIETETLNKDYKLIVVRNFENKESAMIYFLSIIRKPLVFKTLAGKKFLNFIVSNNNFRQLLSDRTLNDYLPFFVKNYSSRTETEFKESDLDAPEALMARLKLDENDNSTQKGEFVEVKADDSKYESPVQKEQFYKLDYNEPHTFMLLVQEPRYKTGSLMREFVQFNSTEYRSARLKVVPNNFQESTALLISSFANGYEAMEYLKKAEANKALFGTLGAVKYTLHVVSDNNLKKLKESNNFEEFEKFYKACYVLRKPTAPVKPAETKNAEEVKPEVSKADQNLGAEKEKVEEQKPTALTEKAENKPEPTVEVKKEEPIKEEPKAVTSEEKVAPVKDEAAQVKLIESYTGPFVFAPDTLHALIYILPSSGSNKTLLSTYLTRLNAMNYRDKGLTVTIEEFNEFQSLVVVNGLKNKAEAAQYFNTVNADSRVIMSLRNVNYRSFLIAKPNLQQFKIGKSIPEYQKFYELAY